MRLGFIGVGNMGNPIATNLIKKGHQLSVHDLNQEIATNLLEMGAAWAESPKIATEGNEVIFTSLPGPREVEAVALGGEGILEGATPSTIYVDLSSNSPTTIRRIHQRFQSQGIEVLDAPVSGGVDGAADGTLSVMVGGDSVTFHKLEPVFAAFGSNVFYCGPIGNGMVCKICNNLMAMGITNLLAESLTLGVKAGVDLNLLANVISKSSGHSRRLQERMPHYLFKGNFQPGFAAKLAAKDVRLATDLGREFGLPMEISNLIDQQYVEAMVKGWGDMDADIIAMLQEEKTGIHLRTKQE